MPKPPIPKKLSPRLIERHETLFPKLQALTRTVQALSARRPGRLVPEEMRVTAEALLFEALPFSAGRRRELPVAAPDCAGLAGQLRAALAALMAFEARHSQWDMRFGEPVWMADDPHIHRLKRLAPKPGSKAAAKAAARAEMNRAARAARMLEIRALLVKRLTQYKMRAPELRPAPPVSASLPVPESATHTSPPRTGPSIRSL